MLERISKAMTIKVSVSSHTVVRVISVALSFIIGLWLIYLTRPALVLIGVAFFLALALSPPVNYLARKLPKQSRGLATGIAYILVLFILGVLLYAMVPPLVQQTQSFINNLPTIINDLETGNGFIAEQARKYDMVDSLRQSQEEITGRISDAGGPILTLLQRISSSIVAILTVLVLTFFMLVEGPGWLKKFWALQLKDRRKRRQKIATQMYRAVTGYVNGQLTIAFIAGIAALIMLTIIGVPFAVPLAGIIMITGIIPLIGNTLGAVVVIAVGLFTSVATAIALTIFFIVYQQIENTVLQPIIQSRSVELTPLIVFISAIIGVTLAGILGALLAIPVAACIKILVNDYIDRKKLLKD